MVYLNLLGQISVYSVCTFRINCWKYVRINVKVTTRFFSNCRRKFHNSAWSENTEGIQINALRYTISCEFPIQCISRSPNSCNRVAQFFSPTVTLNVSMVCELQWLMEWYQCFPLTVQQGIKLSDLQPDFLWTHKFAVPVWISSGRQKLLCFNRPIKFFATVMHEKWSTATDMVTNRWGLIIFARAVADIPFILFSTSNLSELSKSRGLDVNLTSPDSIIDSSFVSIKSTMYSG